MTDKPITGTLNAKVSMGEVFRIYLSSSENEEEALSLSIEYSIKPKLMFDMLKYKIEVIQLSGIKTYDALYEDGQYRAKRAPYSKHKQLKLMQPHKIAFIEICLLK
ncbi:hypothetical protein E2R68_13415 [Psychromonas sp. RZ22]|uniref:hypothetical protein n=1 Tax=Psychromonas algarum TaxID=2555643 RepID=UPI0010671E03|nr:hypothetical protein [Psychromonas sp. RZ22]TEW53185.1 hypothetical protein E2R68_13415 [Psychromonas sp. RZ22]